LYHFAPEDQCQPLLHLQTKPLAKRQTKQGLEVSIGVVFMAITEEQP
jgi:hypothetical protein